MSSPHDISYQKARPTPIWNGWRGYIALRKLNEPKTALVHFQNHRSVIKSPISRGRAAYWTGRAYEELGDEAAASQGLRRWC